VKRERPVRTVDPVTKVAPDHPVSPEKREKWDSTEEMANKDPSDLLVWQVEKETWDLLDAVDHQDLLESRVPLTSVSTL